MPMCRQPRKRYVLLTRYVSTVRMLILKQGMRISVDAVHLSVELSLWIIARCVHSKLCFIGFSKGQRAWKHVWLSTLFRRPKLLRLVEKESLHHRCTNRLSRQYTDNALSIFNLMCVYLHHCVLMMTNQSCGETLYWTLDTSIGRWSRESQNRIDIRLYVCPNHAVIVQCFYI